MQNIDFSLQKRPMHVLVVDDDPAIVQLIKVSIEKRFAEQIRVVTESDPAQARGRLESDVIDMLITDIQMPGISGLQLFRCAKRRNAWTQVVLVTGHSDVEALTEAMDLGANDYLVKPIRRDDLEQAVSEAYARLVRWRRSLASTLFETRPLPTEVLEEVVKG
jgi:YesN/AraC family two-component response regulator